MVTADVVDVVIIHVVRCFLRSARFWCGKPPFPAPKSRGG